MARMIGLAVALVCLAVMPAQAATILLGADLDGSLANAGAGTGSSGTGRIDLTLDDQTNLLSWTGTFSGLSGTFTVAHLHGPALPNQNAGVTVGTAVTVDPGGLSGSSVGSATITPTQAADLLAGLWYWNVHSSFATGGEIRGNISIIPEPGTALLLGLGLAGLGARRRSGA